jgi:hypothetical protein
MRIPVRLGLGPQEVMVPTKLFRRHVHQRFPGGSPTASAPRACADRELANGIAMSAKSISSVSKFHTHG